MAARPTRQVRVKGAGRVLYEPARYNAASSDKRHFHAITRTAKDAPFRRFV